MINDADTCFDDASVTDVDMFAYVDFTSSLCTLASLKWPRISRLLQSGDGHVGTNLYVPSNENPPIVKRLTARPNGSIVSNGEVVAIVAVKRRRHIDAVIQMTAEPHYA